MSAESTTRGSRSGGQPSATSISISSEVDVVLARQQGRILAERLGFSSTGSTLIATAISELARNIIQYAQRGEIALSVIQNSKRHGLQIVARDQGVGIPDVRRALEDGYSTSQGLGLGLPGAKRLVDEFDIVSEVGKGTTVTLKKWLD